MLLQWKLSNRLGCRDILHPHQLVFVHSEDQKNNDIQACFERHGIYYITHVQDSLQDRADGMCREYGI